MLDNKDLSPWNLHELHAAKNKSKNPIKVLFVTRSKNLFKNPNSLNPLNSSYQSAILNP